ncbi:hypothetical protein J6590_007839 [Homalodisca vitripennis]|nr:hypothetical protein J6590_007839 [Homalodisca vitripennis]
MTHRVPPHEESYKSPIAAPTQAPQKPTEAGYVRAGLGWIGPSERLHAFRLFQQGREDNDGRSDVDIHDLYHPRYFCYCSK